MAEYHDPIRQANYIQQSLSQDKKPIGIFLSAGCPSAIKININGCESPLIPGIEGLTKAVCDKLVLSEKKEAIGTVLTHFKTDEREAPNIEDILSHIRILHQVAGKESVRGLTSTELDQLDHEICETIVTMVKKELPNKDTPYHKVAAWIGAIQRTHPVEIFTTNYDLLMEQALEQHRVPYFDGFVGSHHSFFDSYAIEEDVLPSRWARLWKLHGSVNWCQNDKGVSRSENNSGQRHVIHPSHLKYEESRRMPYLAMIDRLRSFFKKTSPILITCGYSFRDQHLNANLLEGLQGNSTAIIFALVHGELKKYPNAIGIASNSANFNLLAEDEAMVGTKRLSWIEKESIDSSSHQIAVEWVAKDKKTANSPKQGRFKLGDFVQFGTLLEDLIGAGKQKEF